MRDRHAAGGWGSEAVKFKGLGGTEVMIEAQCLCCHNSTTTSGNHYTHTRTPRDQTKTEKPDTPLSVCVCARGSQTGCTLISVPYPSQKTHNITLPRVTMLELGMCVCVCAQNGKLTEGGWGSFPVGFQTVLDFKTERKHKQNTHKTNSRFSVNHLNMLYCLFHPVRVWKCACV